jgi:hypothetical protein
VNNCFCYRLVIDALNKSSADPATAFLPLCNSLNDPNVPMSMKVDVVDWL